MKHGNKTKIVCSILKPVVFARTKITAPVNNAPVRISNARALANARNQAAPNISRLRDFINRGMMNRALILRL